MMDTGPRSFQMNFGNKKVLETNCLKDDEIAVVPPCFARSLTEAAFGSANTPLRCDVRTRRDLCPKGGRPRNSETMFSRPFQTSSHQPRLSALYLPWVLFSSSSFAIKFSKNCLIVI